MQDADDGGDVVGQRLGMAGEGVARLGVGLLEPHGLHLGAADAGLGQPLVDDGPEVGGGVADDRSGLPALGAVHELQARMEARHRGRQAHEALVLLGGIRHADGQEYHLPGGVGLTGAIPRQHACGRGQGELGLRHGGLVAAGVQATGEALVALGPQLAEGYHAGLGSGAVGLRGGGRGGRGRRGAAGVDGDEQQGEGKGDGQGDGHDAGEREAAGGHGGGGGHEPDSFWRSGGVRSLTVPTGW
ncbi:MAG: hypothetical protein IPL60_12280 [Ardenticatenia bacterium]|nr:hypothetical protein [Ardenticatenia bacterium]